MMFEKKAGKLVVQLQLFKWDQTSEWNVFFLQLRLDSEKRM